MTQMCVKYNLPTSFFKLWEKNVEVRYEKQNPNLYNFSGNIKLSESQKVPLDNKNLILRACSLRSSYAIGLVAYSGYHTSSSIWNIFMLVTTQRSC